MVIRLQMSKMECGVAAGVDARGLREWTDYVAVAQPAVVAVVGEQHPTSDE